MMERSDQRGPEPATQFVLVRVIVIVIAAGDPGTITSTAPLSTSTESSGRATVFGLRASALSARHSALHQ
jgi:hypothetical protein